MRIQVFSARDYGLTTKIWVTRHKDSRSLDGCESAAIGGWIMLIWHWCISRLGTLQARMKTVADPDVVQVMSLSPNVLALALV